LSLEVEPFNRDGPSNRSGRDQVKLFCSRPGGAEQRMLRSPAQSGLVEITEIA